MPWTIPLFILSLVLTIAVYPFTAHPVAFGNVMEAVGLVVAAVNLTLTASAFGRKDAPRRAWMRLAIGIWIWIIAQFMGMYCELILNQVSYGTLADTFWVIGYFPLISGLYLLVSNYRSTGLPMGSTRSYVIQGVVLLAAYTALFFTLIWGQVLNPDRNLVLKLLDVGYPTFDLVLIAMGSVLLRVSWLMRGGSLARSWLFLCVGFALTCVADVILAYTTDFDSLLYHFQDAFYYIAYFMIALAAKYQYDIIASD